MLNDFNNHRSNRKNKISNIVNEEENIDSLNNNNIDLIDSLKSNQLNISNNYNKNLKEYINDENNMNYKNFENINYYNSNNNSYDYKQEINKIKQENIILKAKMSENELVINQYKKTINTLKNDHSKEIKKFQNHINVLNNFILIIYKFFDDISNNYLHELNFNYNYNDNFELIDINEFQENINIIEKYISSMNNHIIESNNNKNFNSFQVNERISIEKKQNNNPQKENEIQINSLNIEQEKSSINNEIKNQRIYNDNHLLDYNNIYNEYNENTMEKFPDENNNIIYSQSESESINNFGLIQLYKNLENKFDLLEKEIEEGKRKKYEYLNEQDKKFNNNKNNNINITNITNDLKYEKNYFLENLYKEEKNKKNKSAKKNNNQIKITRRNIKGGTDKNKYISENNRNKTPSNIRKNIKKKK